MWLFCPSYDSHVKPWHDLYNPLGYESISEPACVSSKLKMLKKWHFSWWFLGFLTPTQRPKNENYAYSWNIPLEISLMIPESQKHLVTLPLVTSLTTLKMSKNSIFWDFWHFCPLPRGPKMKIRPIPEIYP